MLFILYCVIFPLSSNGYILPQIYREWIPIAQSHQLNSHAIPVEIGNLPLVIVRNSNNIHFPILRSCPTTGLIYNNHNNNRNHSIGNIINRNGIVYWTYKAYSQPYAPTLHPFRFQIDISHHFISTILFIMDDFLKDVHENTPIKVNKNKRKLFIRYRDNKFLFIYPYTILMKHRTNYRQTIYQNICCYPVKNNKTRLFISTNNLIYKIFLILFYISHNMYQPNDFKYKYMLIDNTYSLMLLQLFSDYMCIFNDNTIYNFLINRRYY